MRASRADAKDIDDLRELVAFFKKFGPMSVTAFCEGYGALPAKNKSTAGKGTSAKSNFTIADDPEALAYVTKLKADPLGVSGTIEAIDNDDSLSLLALKVIVSEIVGTASGITSKKKALTALVKWQDKNRARSQRGENVEGGF